MLDAGWRTLKTKTAIEGSKRWRDNARMVLEASLNNSESLMKKFGIGENTTRDVLWQLTKAPNQSVRETRSSHHVKRVNEAITKVDGSDSMQEGNFTLGEDDDENRFIRPAGAVAIARGGVDLAKFQGSERLGWNVTVPEGDAGGVHRNLHTLVATGSLPAAAALYSPLVTENRAVRMLPNNQLAFSSDRLARHQRLFIECALGNSLIPGFVTKPNADPYAATPTFFKKGVQPASLPGDPPPLPPPPPEEQMNTLPVSYDMLSIYLTRCMQQTFVFDTTEHIQQMLQKNPRYDRSVAEIQKDTPEFCSRFPTYEKNSASPVYFEWSSQESRHAAARSTRSRSDDEITDVIKKAEERHGRPLKATSVEVANMLEEESKTTNMPVGGNIFSFSCWWQNTVYSMSQKGLIAPSGDPVLLAIEDSVLGVHSRLQRSVSGLGHMSNYFVVAPTNVGVVPSATQVNQIESATSSHSEGVAKAVSSHAVGFAFPAVKRRRV